MKFPIYFPSRMHIEDKLWTSLLSDFMYLYKTVVLTNIEMFVLFLYVLFFPEKEIIIYPLL